MPKVFGREFPTWMIAAVSGLTLYLVVDQLFPSDTPVSKKSTSKKLTKKSDGDDLYTAQDRTAKFAVFTEPPKNAFQPLIAKTTTGPMGAIPPGGMSWLGEANWSYTGYVVVDGRVKGLVENASTGQGVYLRVGDVWKQNKVRKISPTEMVLDDSTGTHTVKLGEASQKIATAPGTGIAPVNPLQGAIGGALPNGTPAGGVALGQPGQPQVGQPGGPPGLTIQPMDANADTTDNMDTGFRRRGRRRGG